MCSYFNTCNEVKYIFEILNIYIFKTHTTYILRKHSKNNSFDLFNTSSINIFFL